MRRSRLIVAPVARAVTPVIVLAALCAGPTTPTGVWAAAAPATPVRTSTAAAAPAAPARTSAAAAPATTPARASTVHMAPAAVVVSPASVRRADRAADPHPSDVRRAMREVAKPAKTHKGGEMDDVGPAVAVVSALAGAGALVALLLSVRWALRRRRR
jgi:hypothetical protein